MCSGVHLGLTVICELPPACDRMCTCTACIGKVTMSACSHVHPATGPAPLQCQICLCTLRDCVALEPCGHSFCAACLSHHLASLLESGQPLSCPLRSVQLPSLHSLAGCWLRLAWPGAGCCGHGIVGLGQPAGVVLHTGWVGKGRDLPA